ncbi:MAG: hypothetical protein M5U26_16600 [Planctomycetota bacterium]|nr:hypothetical protein [Planctomycetota bacterium]
MERSEPLGLPFATDPVIEVYKKDLDRTLIRENLKLSPDQRYEKFLRFMQLVAELRRAGQQSKKT